MSTTFSVVIPCHNAEQTIVEALQSVVDQTFPPHQVIVVDDGSIDGSSSLIESRFGQVQLIRQANAGAGPARNVGASVASGEFIAFLDADDLWMPNHLEALAEAASELPDALMLGSMAPHRDNSRRRFQRIRGRRGPASPRRVDFFAAARRRRLAGIINMSSVAFSATVFGRLGLRFQPATLSEDDAFFCEVGSISDLALVPYPTVRVRARPDSVTGSIRIDESRTDCSRLMRLEHAKAATRIADDPTVDAQRRTSAGKYRDDLLVRHWITVAANRHQHCAREALPTIRHAWTPNALAFRTVAVLPDPIAAVIAPIARAVLAAAGIPTHSPFHVREIGYRTGPSDSREPRG